MSISQDESKYQNGVKLSNELSPEDKNFILSMNGYKETALIPMLTEKIIILNKNIKKLNKTTGIFSLVLIILAIIQIIIAIISLL